MIFTEVRFLLFFLTVFCVHWLLPSHRNRKIFLLIASYAFYGAWDWRFCFLILCSTLLDFTVARRIHANEDQLKRRRWLMVSLVANLGLLAVFKYFNFFMASSVDFLQMVGLQANWTTLNIVLPVGISFYTFQTLSYTIDIYRRQLEPAKSLLDMMLFVSFFPQLVAGPIVRARNFLPQLVVPVSLKSVDIKGCLVLFLIGYFKKSVVGDTLAPVVDLYYADYLSYDTGAAWLALLLFTVQVYVDFSGYSDMALATAGLLGYRLGRNFHSPLLSTNITDFWRRWHISLSAWLRDYVFISLGGSRVSVPMIIRNLMITMVLSGLWHGAGWTWVIFGVIHGVLLSGSVLWRRRRGDQETTFEAVIGVPITFTLFLLSLIFFRAPDLASACEILVGALTFHSYGDASLSSVWLPIVAVLGVCHWALYRDFKPLWWRAIPNGSFAIGYGACAELSLLFSAPLVEPFVYFQF